MAAANTDYFGNVGSPGTATTLAAPGHAIGGQTLNVVSTANWPTATGCFFAMDTVTLLDGVEVRDVGSYTEWEGVVTSATVISNATLKYGTDQTYPAGSTTRLYIPVSSSRENALVDGLLIAHDQDGTLKAGAVDGAAVLASGVVTTAKILDNNVTASKLSTSAITLGYAQITSNFSTASTTPVQVTGLTSTVTIPDGGRRTKITVYFRSVNNTGAFRGNYITLWDGTVGSGTQLQELEIDIDSATFNVGGTLIAVVSPSAGSKTYNVGLRTGADTVNMLAASTYPAFILVEAI